MRAASLYTSLLIPALFLVPLSVSASVYHEDPLASLIAKLTERITSATVALPDSPSPEAFRRANETEKMDVIEKLIERDPRYAWSYLKAVGMVDGEAVINAHEFAHVVGNELYRRYGVGRGMGACDTSFAYGCYHGVAEEALRKTGPAGLPNLVAECRSSVPKETRDNPLSYSGCTHGAGHGLLTWESLNVRAALRNCDTLRENERPYCYDGVFMEYAFSAPESRNTNVDDAVSFCNAFGEGQQVACARYRVVSGITEETVSKRGEACGRLSHENASEQCYDSIGFFAAQTSQGSIEAIMKLCAPIAASSGRLRCVSAAAGEMVFQAYEEWREKSANLCASLADSREITFCLKRVESVREQYQR